jgi:hypothetical protein
MPLLRRPLYQRSDGRDEDCWRLVFDTDARRLFVEHEEMRGDMCGAGYGLHTDEIEIAAFLADHGQGQQELLRLIGGLFGDDREAGRAEANEAVFAGP